MQDQIDIQGHRGCRGLRPENTIPAFQKAIDLGVTTLELDVVVNKFNDVIISHEPFFNHAISLTPDGEEIPESEEKKYNLYPMTLEEIQAFDVGKKTHPTYPLQKKMEVHKPSLREMVSFIETYVDTNNLPLPEYNIEIKRVAEEDGLFHPPMDTFARVVCDEIIDLGIASRSTIQCFDFETLRFVRRAYPNFRLVALVANQKSLDENLKELDFVPWAYSPYFKLVTGTMVEQCREKKMRLIPWTVNEENDITQMLNMGVDGIISDYPDRVIELVAARSLESK